MSQPVRASIGTIVTTTTAYLATETGLDPTRVFVTALSPDETPRFGATQDILVRPMNEEPDMGIIDGAGRFDNRRTRTIEIAIRTRVMLDQAGRDAVRLADASLGHFALEDKVCDALELYYPSDEDSGDALSLPFRVNRLTSPQRLRADATWVFSTFSVTVEYRRDLDITRI